MGGMGGGVGRGGVGRGGVGGEGGGKKPPLGTLHEQP